MSALTVHCLASGSSANAFLVTCPEGAVLLDAGLGMRTLRRYVEERGVPSAELLGICVTHEHGDHSIGAVPYSCRWKVPIVATEGTLVGLQRADPARREPLHRVIERDGGLSLGPLTVEAFSTCHDAFEPCGFRVSWGEHAVALATDTGVVTDAWRTACRGCQLLIVEANHDLNRLRFGPYPEHLKRRILAQTGHLDNDGAVELVLTHTDAHGPVAVWFAHLSEVNNTPGAVISQWNRAWRAAGHKASPAAIEIARRDTPSLVWQPGKRAVQPALFQATTPECGSRREGGGVSLHRF